MVDLVEEGKLYHYGTLEKTMNKGFKEKT